MTKSMLTAGEWGLEDKSYSEQDVPSNYLDSLNLLAESKPNDPAFSFQLMSGAKDPAVTLTWLQSRDRTIQAANAFHKLGVDNDNSVAYLLPNCQEVVVCALGGAIAGVVSAVNPVISAEHIAGILRESKAKVVVTLAPFPKTEVAQTVAEALKDAPDVQTVLTVDLLGYLSGLKKFIVPLIRPKVDWPDRVTVRDFNKELDTQSTELAFEMDRAPDRVCGYMHTGGTTGRPKVAQHLQSGTGYISWLGKTLIGDSDDVWICPLPMFHVFGAHVILDSVLGTGAHMVMVTPQGYRGDGVFDNFWALVERWKVSIMVMVPTAATQLMQRPIKNDVSSLRLAVCGSAPLPVALFNRFQDSTGVKILEGYGMTETTGLISVNPVEGERRIGSVGFPLPYTEIVIVHCDTDGKITKMCEADETGEICVASPGVVHGSTYTEDSANQGLYADDKYFRTGDLGYMDKDGYLWITGRAKDLIIRGGHNIDPAIIEEALVEHPAVALAGAIGQPDSYAGELPCAYVELVQGADVTIEELLSFLEENISERAAIPKYIEIMDEIPKTLVGKIFKPDLRRSAIKRVFDGEIAEHGARVAEITEDKKRGLVAHVRKTEACNEEAVRECLGKFSVKWEFEK